MSIKSLSFLGTALILVNDLSLDQMKHIDEKTVKGLARDFKRNGCRNHDVAHAVPALVDPMDLNAVLARANLSPSALRDGGNTPTLYFKEEEKPRILYGDHRLRAIETLSRNERLWLVSLYDLGITAKDRASILQLNRHKSTALNGRDLANFLAEGDQEVLNVWMSHMSPTHQTTFSQLRKIDNGKLSRKVQELLRFRGLQYHHVGNWERVLSMHCREEVYAYLDAMSRTWEYILGSEVRPDQLDESTVLALQMYCPAYSSHDCEIITKLFVDNKVFPSSHGTPQRDNIGRRILSCKRIVTFASFFDDFIYLRTCFNGLCQLLPRNWRENGSFQQAFKHEWSDTMGDRDTTGLQTGCHSNDFQDCYVDLWLFAMRNFPCLTDGKASQPLQYGVSVDDHTEFRSLFRTKRTELACLASKHGFETDAIKRYKVDYPIHQDSAALEKPEVSCNDSSLKWKERSNRPSRTNYIRSKDFLQRVYVYDSTVEQKKYVTAYAIAREIVHCCWRPDIERWVDGPEVRQQPQYSNKKRSLGGNHDGPRHKLARHLEDYTEANERGRTLHSENRRVVREARKDRQTKKQQEYEELFAEITRGFNSGKVENEFTFGEVATGFAFGDAHPGASATHRDEEEADLKENIQVAPIKEELQHQVGVKESIEHDAEDKMHVSPQPLAVAVDENRGRMSEGSKQAEDDKRRENEMNLFDDPSRSEDESIYSEHEEIPMLPDTLEAVVRGSTQSPIAGDVLETSTKDNSRVLYAQTERQCANNTSTATGPDTRKHKKSSSRQSSEELNGSASRSSDSGSTSWPRPYIHATASRPTDTLNGHQAGRKKSKHTTIKSPGTISNTARSRREWKYQSVFPGGWQGAVKSDKTGTTPLDHRVLKGRQSIFPGQSGIVQADASELTEILPSKGTKRKQGR